MEGVLGKVARRVRGLVERLAPRSIYLDDRFPNYDIGKHSYGDLALVIYSTADGNLRIGSYCSFAAGVKIFLGCEHRTDWVSTYPFNALDPCFSYIKGHPHTKGDVSIGNDVWLGREAVILSGVKIGNGAVVGAYAVVTKDVSDYGIVAGNPAKLVRMRFPPEIVSRWLEIQWWGLPDSRVRA